MKNWRWQQQNPRSGDNDVSVDSWNRLVCGFFLGIVFFSAVLSRSFIKICAFKMDTLVLHAHSAFAFASKPNQTDPHPTQSKFRLLVVIFACYFCGSLNVCHFSIAHCSFVCLICCWIRFCSPLLWRARLICNATQIAQCTIELNSFCVWNFKRRTCDTKWIVIKRSRPKCKPK